MVSGRVAVVDGDLDNLYYADEPEDPPLPRKRVPTGDVYEAARAGDVERLRIVLERGVNVNARDAWDSVALYYACLAGHLNAAHMLLESGAICSEHTFDGDRCHYAALNLRVRKLLKAYEARPPPLEPLPRSLRHLFFSLGANSKHNDATIDNGYANSQDFAGEREDFPNLGFLKGFSDKRKDEFMAQGAGVNHADIVFHVEGKFISAHRAILAARSPFFRKKFSKDWNCRHEIRFSNKNLKFSALFSLIQFFYTDRLDVAVDDMEDLARICKVCGCTGLQIVLRRELQHQRFAEYKSLKDVEDSQKRFILQGSSLVEDERLPAAMRRLFYLCLKNSGGSINKKQKLDTVLVSNEKIFPMQDPSIIAACLLEAGSKSDKRNGSADGVEVQSDDLWKSSVLNREIDEGWDEKTNTSTPMDYLRQHNEREAKACYGSDQWEFEDYTDVNFLVEGRMFRSHQAIVAARSDYLKARISRMNGFREESQCGYLENDGLLVLEEHDLSANTFEKLLEYIYTDAVTDICADQAEEMFDAASRYLLFPLKRAISDALLPQLDTATPAELCQWLMIADMYGVMKLREHCLDFMAVNLDVFAGTSEFRKLLRILPPPSGDTSTRTTAPSAPGEETKDHRENLLDDLREKWLEAEGAELDRRDESAEQFDKILAQLVSASDLDEPEEIDAAWEMQISKLSF